MTLFHKQDFIGQLTRLQFSSDRQNTWKSIEEGTRENAQLIQGQRIQDGESGSEFGDWWRSCCDLFLSRQIVISALNYDASAETDEYIELFNTGPAIVDLSGWRINAGNEGQDMVFPYNTLIRPLSSIRIYTNESSKYRFNSRNPIWNNKGDKALLFDQSEQLICTWNYGKKSHDYVFISHIFYDGIEERSESDEYVEISNLSLSWIDISGWTISSGNEQAFVFPANAVIKPKSKIKVFTNFLDVEPGGYSFNSKRAVWNNKGGTGYLTDYQGKSVSEYSYG